jgi:hypothetical protein
LRRRVVADRCGAREYQPGGNGCDYACVNGHREPPWSKYPAENTWFVKFLERLPYNRTADFRSFASRLDHASSPIYTIFIQVS